MDSINNSYPQQKLHLTKIQRLPQYLKETEKVIRTVMSCESNFKTVLAKSRLHNSIYKKVYNLSLNVLKHYSYIQKIIDDINLLKKEQFLRREIASVLIYEMIFGTNYFPGESKIITTLRTYENDIKKAHQKLQSSCAGSFLLKEVNIPRYVRVHTLVTTVSYVIKDLECLGFKLINYDNISEEKYLELVKNLEQGYFLIDFHFKDILVFAHNENLIYLDLYKNGHIFLQDKASCIPVHALNPEPGHAVLDACAAPGMKTIYIASKMKNKGILIACERDKNRFDTLKEIIQCGAIKICKALCKDFKELNPSDQAYSAIELILLDPSCSGSGMVSRMDEVTDAGDSKSKERLIKLAGFQIILLKHALKFPSVKRVVYSTCSVNEEENEYVVHEVLSSCHGLFKLVPVMPEWSVRGSENFEFGNLCLRAVPEKHLTNGFFVAMFERVEAGEEIHFSKNKKHEIIANISQNEGENFSDFKKINKMKKHGENSFDIHNKQDDDNVFLTKKLKKSNANRLDILNDFPEDCESSGHIIEEGHVIKQTNYNCKSKKNKRKKGNLIDSYSENNNVLTIDDCKRNVFGLHKAKEHESCEQLLYQFKQNDNSLSSKYFKKNGDANKKEKREKEVNFLSKVNEGLPEKRIDLDSQTLNRTVDGTCDVSKTKKKHKHKRHLNSKAMTDDNSNVTVHKKKRKHSKYSDFNSDELVSPLVPDNNSSLIHNVFLSENDGLSNSSKKRKDKKQISQYI